MATKAETALPNFAAGELSPKMRGRFDLPIYFSGCETMRNFIAETQGPTKFRTGTRFVLHTRLNQIANLISFQFNDEQAYILEFTDLKLRFYREEANIVASDVTITDITQANPGVVTAGSHGYENGDEVFIQSVVGMTEVNGKTFIVAGKNPNDFQLTDVDGNNVNTSGFTAYDSAGVAQKIVEIDTPYAEVDNLFLLQVTQNADTMYIVHPFYEPRKLTRTGHTSWTLAKFDRTADPFLTKQVISGITQANPGVVTVTGHTFVDGDQVVIDEVVGMTEVNGRHYVVNGAGVNDFKLNDVDGNTVDTSGFTAYGSVGYASDRDLLPEATAFYEGRLFYGASEDSPQKFWGSRAPQTTGVTRYDDFTTGTDADHAIINVIASREVNKIRWLAGTDRFLAIGTFSAEFKVTGDTEDEAIAPLSINVRPISFFGVAAQTPINKENAIIYVQRGKRTVRSLEFDVLQDGYISVDRNLVADHITIGGIKQLAFQAGRPDIVWAVKDDGKLIGVTFKSREDVSGWHRHDTDGGNDSFISVAIMPRPTAFDQVWVVVTRTINSLTRRYVEFFEDEPVIPELIDFYTAETAKAANTLTFLRAMFEAQKNYFHVDSGLTFDGTAAGTSAGATVTPAATTGTGVAFTASASVFAATDVGRQIWKKSVNGVGTGRATITAFVSATEVTCTIDETFDSTDAIAAGSWYFTVLTLSGFDHLEGESLTIVADGAVHDSKTVASGSITLDTQSGMVHGGIGYDGILKTMNLEAGGVTGPSQTKKKSVSAVGIRFFQTLGAFYGTDLYKMTQILFRSSADFTNRPPPLFSGDRRVAYHDRTTEEKHVIIQQKQPLPCVVQLLVPFVTTSNQ